VTAQTAFAAVAALPGPHGRDAAVLLAGIAAAHDLADIAEVLEEWERDRTVSPQESREPS
jgi:hypothetical protein